MSDALFDLSEFAPSAPSWAVDCFYCSPDAMGEYDRARHDHGHLPITCEICGDEAPNRLLFDMNHGVCLGACYDYSVLLCTSLWLRINHLRYDMLNTANPSGYRFHPRDLTVLDLGWVFAADGTALPPAGWPQFEVAS